MIARLWDSRLDQRGAILTPATPAPGESYWQLVRGEWRNEAESQGLHHILVDVLDRAGGRLPHVGVRFWWADGQEIKLTERKPGEDYAVDFPMFAAGWAYGVQIVDGPSDRVDHLGLGTIAAPWAGVHTSYRFAFQLVTVALPISPGPQIPVGAM